MVCILIVEDLEALREHARRVLSTVINDDLRIEEAADGHQGIKLATTLNPDLIIMDIAMPELNGIKAAEKIWKQRDSTRILFWSQHHRETYVRSLGKIVPDEAIHGYLLKGETDSKLSEAVSSILFNGNPYIDPVVRGIQKKLKSRDNSISDSEYETLMDVAVGLTDRAIACRRHISVRGVQNRLAMLLGKLVKGDEAYLKESTGMEIFNPRARILFAAVRRGLVDPDELNDLDERTWDWIEDEFDYDRDP